MRRFHLLMAIMICGMSIASYADIIHQVKVFDIKKEGSAVDVYLQSGYDSYGHCEYYGAKYIRTVENVHKGDIISFTAEDFKGVSSSTWFCWRANFYSNGKLVHDTFHAYEDETGKYVKTDPLLGYVWL